jgi:tRNA 5-methylaminomethyl-2-thiouridine biosynthesis bifunctional protein
LKAGVTKGAVLSGQAIVIGAGIAGASVAQALARRGMAVTVLERGQPACGGSGNPVAVVRAEPGGSHNPIAELSTACMAWLFNWMARHGQAVPHDFCGVIKMTRDQRRHQKLATHVRDNPSANLREISQIEASKLCGQPVADAGFYLADAGWLQPAALVAALLAHPMITTCAGVTVKAMQRDAAGCWQLSLADGTQRHAAVVIMASAFAAPLLPVSLGLDSARGQLSCLPARQDRALQTVICRDGYITPAINGMHTIGATIQRHDDCADARAADNEENFQRLSRLLPGFANSATTLMSGRVGWRAVTQDRLPLVGRIDEGLYASLGHGARGVTCAPLCGEWLAALIAQEILPLPPAWKDWLDPLRFCKKP